jgi:hypothetical protein
LDSTMKSRVPTQEDRANLPKTETAIINCLKQWCD